MPIYEYRCTACETEFEELVSASAKTGTAVPELRRREPEAALLDVRDRMDPATRRLAQDAEQARHGRRRGLAAERADPEGRSPDGKKKDKGGKSKGTSELSIPADARPRPE